MVCCPKSMLLLFLTQFTICNICEIKRQFFKLKCVYIITENKNIEFENYFVFNIYIFINKQNRTADNLIGRKIMAVGPRDRIDQLLVQKYAMEKVDNPSLTTLVDSGKMMETITDYASMQKNMFMLNNKLKNICSAINIKSAAYVDRRKMMQQPEY